METIFLKYAKKAMTEGTQSNSVFATNSNFIILISSQPDRVNL